MDNRETGTARGAERAGIGPQTIHREASGSPPSGLPGVTGEERHQLIAEAAYFRAERRSFMPGYELEDWLNAEAEVEIKLKDSGKIRSSENL